MSKPPFAPTVEGLYQQILLVTSSECRLPVGREVKFHPVRQWRFDVAILAIKIAFEFEGGTWSSGRHTRGMGFEGDCEKYNSAMQLQWAVYRFTGAMTARGDPALCLLAYFQAIKPGGVNGATLKILKEITG